MKENKKGQTQILGIIVGFLISIILFSAVLPTILDRVDAIDTNENVSADTKLIVSLYPLMIALVILVSLVGGIVFIRGG